MFQDRILRIGFSACDVAITSSAVSLRMNSKLAVTLGSSGLPVEAGFLAGVTHRRFVAPSQEFLSASHLFLGYEAAWRLLRRQGVKSP